MKTLEALTKIKEELARIGIAKDQENERFMFRSIDAMYNVLGPLFAKYGVHTIPVVEERTQEVFETAKGTKMFHVVLRVQYHLYTADPDTGRKDEMISPVVYGEALDTSDKATHKAMTQAYKYMLIQVLCIPLEAQADSDEEYLRVASYTGDEKEIYDELLAANNAFEFYVFMRSLPRAKQHALHNSHPKGDITKMKKASDKLFKDGWNAYVETWLDPFKKYIETEDAVALAQLKGEVDAQVGQFLNADLAHEEKAQAKVLIEGLLSGE